MGKYGGEKQEFLRGIHALRSVVQKDLLGLYGVPAEEIVEI